MRKGTSHQRPPRCSASLGSAGDMVAPILSSRTVCRLVTTRRITRRRQRFRCVARTHSGPT
eukprot:9502566-Pyramimonas_sp.AAC.1